MPTPPTRTPKSVTLGTGSDSIVLKIAQDWYVADAQYTVTLDGTQIGTTQTVSAYQANAQNDTVTIKCGLTDANHTVAINFLNNAGDGGSGNGHDMNIFVNGATYNGVTIPNVALTLYDENWPNTITFNPVNLLPAKTPKSVTLGTGSDALVFQIAQSWYLADASYNVYIDGAQVGTNQTVSSIRSSGNRDTVTVNGNWSTGTHTVAVNFLNDANDGQTYVVANWHDRIIYLTTARINGAVIPNSTINIGAPSSPHTYTFTKGQTLPSRTPKSVTLGTGSDALVMHISQDWYLADASYNVTVDGTQVGANQTVSAIRSNGNYDTVTVNGSFSTGNHTVAVNFLNDAWDNTVYDTPDFHDRNMYVTDVTFNGTAVPNSTLNILDTGDPHTFTFTKTSTGIPNNPAISVTVGSGVNTIVMRVSQDWYQTNCQYTIAVDGTQIGGTITASAINAQSLYDTVTVKGAFPSGSHTLTVTLLNDDWDGTWGPNGNTPNGHDRNIYVRNVTFNGTAVASSNLDVMDDSPQSFTFSGSGSGGTIPTYPAPLTAAGVTTARLTFSDEFDTLSVSDAGPPTTKWSPWGHGYGTTMSDVNTYNLLPVSNSIVEIKYASGGQNAVLASSNGEASGTGFTQKYGYWEARMKMPATPGMWPAFWLAAAEPDWSNYPDNYEIDINETITQLRSGANNQYITATVHDWQGPSGAHGDYVLDWGEGYGADSSNPDMAAGFHTYAMWWDENVFILYIDGVEKARGTPPTQNVPPVYIIFDNILWPERPDEPTLPASLYIDWVRVWQFPQY